MNTITQKAYFNSFYTGIAFVNNIALRKRSTGEDGSEFMTIELGVRKGEKTPSNFQTDRFSAIVVGAQAKEICEAITSVVDFSIDTIKRVSDGEGRQTVSCSFQASNIRSGIYKEASEVYHCLSGNLIKLEHVYIGGELFAPDCDLTIARQIEEQSKVIREEVERFMASIIDKTDIALDASDPLLNEYVRALAEAGFKNSGNVLHWTAQ